MVEDQGNEGGPESLHVQQDFDISYTVQCPALRIQYMVNRGLRDILSIRTLLFHILHTLLLEQPKDALPVLHLESLCKTGAR